MKWEREEEILLVDLYIYSKTHSTEETEAEISNVSEMLKDRAKIIGIDITEKFRNISGLKMKLQNIEYCFTKGRSGLANYSKFDSIIAEEAKENLVKILLDAAEIKISIKYDRR